jgi:hypothetical protein
MSEIYYARHMKGLPVPWMRTSEPYKTPNIYARTGQYISKTFWYPRGYMSCMMEIHLVWFNRLGWYHSLQFDSHWDNYTENKRPCPKGRKIFEIDFGRKETSHHWTQGKMLPFCAASADEEAKYLVEARGLTLPELAPYVYHTRFLEDAQGLTKRHVHERLMLTP